MSSEEGGSRIKEAFGIQEAPKSHEMNIVRAICRSVSVRAAMIMAVTIFTLWRLQRASFREENFNLEHATPSDQPLAVANCGAVAEKHPTIRKKCQEVLDLLAEAEPGSSFKRRLVLEPALEAGLFGAAVGAIQSQVSTEVDSPRAKL